jgi:ParB/RepB/Spo0J family partition protein
MAKPKGAAEVEKKARRLERLEIQYVDVEAIQPNLYNPNRQSEHDFKLLCKSMEEDGVTQPGVCVHVTEELKADKQFANYELNSIVIVDGEHRWRAARELGMKQIPIVIVDMTPEQMRIATLRHNRARGSEDVELSAQVLRDLQELGALDWAQDSLEMGDAELQKLLDDIPAPEALAAEEFTEAWHPSKGHATEGDQDLGDRTASTTRAAADQQRDVEKRIREAKTEEERQAAQRDSQIFRIICAFGNEEAAAVKRCLGGNEPPIAEKVVKLCELMINGDISVPWEIGPAPEPAAEEAATAAS